MSALVGDTQAGGNVMEEFEEINRKGKISGK